jgi:hypothetical protein
VAESGCEASIESPRGRQDISLKILPGSWQLIDLPGGEDVP